MSFNNLKFLLLLVFTSFLVSCNKEPDKPANDNNTQVAKVSLNRITASELIKNATGFDQTFYSEVNYLKDNDIKQAISGIEIVDKDRWGIQFYFLKEGNDSVLIHYNTELLKGSFEKSMVDDVKLSSKNYNLIYYSSGNFYLGASMGEIFTYLIDAFEKQVYTAHLFSPEGATFSIYLSPNVQDKEIKKFLLDKFKKDFPSAIIAKKDVNLDEL